MQRLTGMPSNKLALLLGAWVLVFCATRFALVPAVIPEWFHADDRLDACIKPWQLLTGQRLAGNDTSYIPFLFYAASYRVFDFSPGAARLVTIPLFAVSLAFYGLAFGRAFGRFVGVFTLGVVLVTVQFITTPVVPTVTCSAFWFSGPALYILTCPLAGHRLLLLGLLLAASLLSYPAGTVAIGPLLVFHLLLFRRSWDRKRIILLLVSIAASLGGVWVVRCLVEARPSVLHWGIQTARFSLEPYLLAIRSTLRDVFVSAESWYAFSGGLPYLLPELSVLLLASLVLAVASYRCREKGAKTRFMSPLQRRWFAVFLLSFLAAVVVASLVPRSPGVRRIFPATLLLLPIAALPLQVLADRGRKRRVTAWVLAVAVVALGAWRSYDVLTNQLTLAAWNRNRPFVEAAADTLATAGAVDRVLFISSFNRHVPEFDACVLHFSKPSRARFGTIEALRLGENGDIKTLMRRHPGEEAGELGATERIVVFTDRELPEDEIDRLFRGQAYQFTRRDLAHPRAVPSQIFVYRSQGALGSP
jgi:hypothetical protein